jgi:hypothetical protein
MSLAHLLQDDPRSIRDSKRNRGDVPRPLTLVPLVSAPMKAIGGPHHARLHPGSVDHHGGASWEANGLSP